MAEPRSEGVALAATRQRLATAYAQLNRYAADLNRTVQERLGKEKDLARANQQLQLYARDLTSSLEAERARAAELESAYYDTVLRLMLASQYRDDETGEHIQRIIDYVRLLGRHWGLSEVEAEVMALASAVHDVGKIAIDDAILKKPGPLTDDEFDAMKQHTVLGARMLDGSPSPLLQQGHEIALTHHERWDGTGYPRGLEGDEIPLAGRLVMLADQYDALRSRRPYKPAFDHEKVIAILLDGDGRTLPGHFEPRLLELFRDIHRKFDEVRQTWRDITHPV